MNLIQSYKISPTTPSIVQKYKSDKIEKEFDVNKELANHTFIRPLPSHGKLVRNSIFDIPAEFFKTLKYDIDSLRHSIRGDANDHELGRLNDMGMKVGGLAIAAYLFGRKSTPTAKLMEFVGLASFFAAMDIWPKLALQLPAKLIHGFNIRQQYEDNYGRKKMVYQDPQFIPWDLYSDEEINRIGDKLKVPKDMQNRREFIQEKMRKIALQNNTMWMLTAGVATPIMSALICNALTENIQKYQNKRIDNEANQLIINFNKEVEKVDFSNQVKALNYLLEENKGKPVTNDLLKQIHANLSDGLDQVVSSYIAKDLNHIIPDFDKFNITDGTLKNVRQIIAKHFSELNLSEMDLAKIVPTEDELLQSISIKELLKENVSDMSKYFSLIRDMLSKKIAQFQEENPNNPASKKLVLYLKKLVHSQLYNTDSQLQSSLKFQSASVLDEQLISQIKSISSTLNTLKAQSTVLDRFAFIKVAQSQETILANTWNLDMSKDLLKIFNFTPQEIKDSRLDSEIAGKILREKMEHIVADDARYNQFLDSMIHKLSVLHHRMETIDVEKLNTTNTYISHTNKSYDDAAANLRKLNMHETADSIAGYLNCSAKDLGKGSSKRIQLSFVNDRIKGVKSSFYRLFNAMDTYRRIAKLPENGSDTLDFQTGMKPANFNEGSVLDYPNKKVLRQVKEEMIELIKEVLINGHSSDYSNKMYMLRSLDVNPEDIVKDYHLKTKEEQIQILKDLYSQIEIQDGKVLNKYLGTHAPTELAELSNDKNFFIRIMKYIYSDNPDASTIKKCGNSAFWNDFLEYRKDLLNILGGYENFAKPGFVVKKVDSTSEERFIKIASALDEMFFKLCKQDSNSRSWLKKFGGIGVGLFGITVLSQFFMGKMRFIQTKKEDK